MARHSTRAAMQAAISQMQHNPTLGHVSKKANLGAQPLACDKKAR
jgi:hypothetical protein